jgi:hypothetical protein
MITIIQFLVLFILVPLLYIGIILFDGLLIIRASTLTGRWRNLASIFAGFLISVIIILLDQNYSGILTKKISTFDSLLWISIIFALIGFLSLLMMDLLLKRGVVPFVILYNVVAVLVSAYFLISSPERTTSTIAFVSLMVGIILYLIIFPSRLANTVLGSHVSEYDNDDSIERNPENKWKL